MKRVLRWMSLAVAAGVCIVSTACVHEIIKPIADTRLFVTHVGDTAVITWQSKAGEEYSIWYANNPEQGLPATWQVLPGSERIAGTGGNIEKTDIVPGGVARYYRIVTRPAVSARK